MERKISPPYFECPRFKEFMLILPRPSFSTMSTTNSLKSKNCKSILFNCVLKFQSFSANFRERGTQSAKQINVTYLYSCTLRESFYENI